MMPTTKQKKLKKVLDRYLKGCYNKGTKKQTNQFQKENDTMTNTKKMTKADYFKQIMANYSLTEEEKAFIQHELDLLARKNSGEKKPTATQVANDAIKDAILDFMEVGKRYTVSDFIKTVPACEGLSNPKVSALVKQLKDDGLVVRTEEKRRAYFSKVE